MGRRGDGVGAWRGRPVFVPRALPGELARVRLGEDRDKGIAARLLEIVEPGAERALPPCPHYESCGGCALQHWDIPAYRAWKTDRVRTLLDRAGLRPATWKDPVFVPEGTRRRTVMAAFVQKGNLRLGYHRARSHDIADIPECLVLSPALRKAAGAMRPYLARLLTDSAPADIFIQDSGGALDVLVTGAVGPRRTPGLAERETMAEMAAACGLARLGWRAGEKDEPETIVQHRPVVKTSGVLAVELPPGAFLQPSAEGEAALAAAVMEAAAEAAPGKIADLFAGCGTFAGRLLSRGPVLAAESGAAETAALTAAARKAVQTAPGLEAIRRNLFSDPLTEKELAGFTAVVMDPPRMGAKEQAERLAGSAVPLAISVSCNPATFTRDAAILCAGGYKFASAQIVDQFVWSSHIEIVGVFRKGGD